MKQAIIYVRVSTDEQADKGYSLPSQEARCRDYAQRMGLNVLVVNLEGQLCFEKYFGGNELEQKVWDYVYGLLTGDFESELREAEAASRREQEPLFCEFHYRTLFGAKLNVLGIGYS